MKALLIIIIIIINKNNNNFVYPKPQEEEGMDCCDLELDAGEDEEDRGLT